MPRDTGAGANHRRVAARAGEGRARGRLGSRRADNRGRLIQGQRLPARVSDGPPALRPKGWITDARVSPKAIAWRSSTTTSSATRRVRSSSSIGPDARPALVRLEVAARAGVATGRRRDLVQRLADRKGGSSALAAVTLAGQERTVYSAPGTLKLHDISRDGERVLLTRGTTRGSILGAVDGAADRDLSWFDYSTVADLSADGRPCCSTNGAKASAPRRRSSSGEQTAARRCSLAKGSRSRCRRMTDGWRPSRGTVTNDVSRQEPATSSGCRAVRLSSTSTGPPGRATDAGFSSPAGRGRCPTHLRPGSRRRRPAPGDSGRVRRPGAVARRTDGGRRRSLRRVLHVLDGRTGRSPPARRLQGRGCAAAVERRWPLPVRSRGRQSGLEDLQLDLATGARQFWKELVPPDPAVLVDIGSDPGQIRLTPDGKSYAIHVLDVRGRALSGTRPEIDGIVA